MFVTYVLAASVVIQLSAAVLALRLIRTTGRWTAWSLVAAAILLMTLRRAVTLLASLSGNAGRPADLPAELVALLISVVLLIGLALIRPIFVSIHESRRRALESEERFRRIVAQTRAGYFRLDRDGRLEETNRSWEEMHGFRSSEEAAGRDFVSTLAEPDSTAAREVIAKLRAGQPVAVDELKRGRLDGTIGYQTLSMQPLVVHGRQLGFEGFIIDTTELERARTELDRFFDLSPDMMCIASADGYFRRINPAFVRVLGYSLEEMQRRPFLEFVHPDDLEKSRRELGAIAGQAPPSSGFENRYLCRDGSFRWLRWTSSPVTVDNLIYATARDITERRAAEEAAALRAQHLAGLDRAAQCLLMAQGDIPYQEFMDAIGPASGASRAYVFAQPTEGAGEICMQAEWVSTGTAPTPASDPFRRLPTAPAFARLAHKLALGEPVVGPTKEFLPAEQVLLGGRSSSSILYQPLLVAGEFWGFIGFESSRDSRPWTSAEVDFLRVACSDLSQAIRRRRHELEREALLADLEASLSKVRTLRGLLPICAACKKVRDDQGYWEQIDVYIRQHAEVEFSHGICPDCRKRLYPELDEPPPA